MALFLSFSGAFETHTVPIVGRTLYWLSLLFAARLTAFGVQEVGTRLIHALWPGLPRWAAALLYMAAATPMIAMVILAVSVLIFRVSLNWGHYLSLLPPVFVITAASTLLHSLLHKVPFRSRAATGPLFSRPAIVSKLPPALQAAEIYAVSAEDHYLLVTTSAGDALIYMRFMDALADLDGIEGAQIHRSHWVARSALTGVDRQHGKTRFIVKGDLRLPVSRTFQKALRDEGWFSP